MNPPLQMWLQRPGKLGLTSACMQPAGQRRNKEERRVYWLLPAQGRASGAGLGCCDYS